MYSRSAPRRRHGAEFKARVLAACDEPGASISGVALANGLNANLVRQWRAGRGIKRVGMAPAARKAARAAEVQASPLVSANPEFVAIAMPAAAKTTTGASTDSTDPTGPHIQVELRRGPLHLSVRWPTSSAEDCGAWLRELTHGLLK